ncbi:MAG TPA: DNA topoisomerase VI subunit B [Candidatus Bathyarchaeia archaeon]|nr:DNA topoisomerase VI subunit B [Candidatus Bathyarchaeia archaeon]
MELSPFERIRVAETTFEEISAADFFYRNRDIAGFTNPARAIFSSIRELIENSLDAADATGIPPDIYVRLSYEDQEKFISALENEKKGEDEEEEEVAETFETGVYRLRIEDNGSGVPARHIPAAFGQVLFGSKYKLKQARGTFGLGGTMALLYGQITTHKPASVISGTGGAKIYFCKLMVDIQRNRPVILDRKILFNKEGWRGTVVDFTLEADYSKAMPRIIEYLKQTALVNPYANITFIDPKGRLYKFTRATTKMPPPPKETKPHPYGVDVETIQRMMRITPCRNMVDFMRYHFLRVGEKTAHRFLEFSGLGKTKDPRKLKPEEIVRLVHMLKRYDGFLAPDASCLSPLGTELLKTGILKELQPEFISISQRPPATYSGHPFIVEAAIAYGGNIPKKNDFVLYRFANRIPLLYDEASDVSWRIIKSMNWRRYRVSPDLPIAILVHLCSTKVPYKTVGKEFIADRPEIKREILNAIRDAARDIQHFLSRRENVERERKRLSTFSKYLPKIAQFSTELAKKKYPPDISKLLKSVKVYEETE